MHIYLLSDGDFWKNRLKAWPHGGGIYIIRCLAQGATCESSKYVPVPRILGSDQDGILYIGRATGQKRLVDLKTSWAPQYVGGNHSIGFRHKSHSSFSELYPFDRIVV